MRLPAAIDWLDTSLWDSLSFLDQFLESEAGIPCGEPLDKASSSAVSFQGGRTIKLLQTHQQPAGAVDVDTTAAGDVAL